MVKKIHERSAENPYKNFPLISKEKIEYEGRTFKVYKHLKSGYSRTEKIKKFAQAFFATLGSVGFALFSKKIRNKWHIVFWGNSKKEFIFPAKALKLHTCEMGKDQKAEFPDANGLKRVQDQLDQANIPLNCQHPAPLENKCTVNRDVINDYLEKLQVEHPDWYALKSKFFNNIDIISYDELKEALAVCCHQLNELLGDQQYSLGFVPEKSQQWIAEHALPHLKKLPQTYFQNEADGGITAEGARGYQEEVKTDQKHFVIFDDCSYSGTQLFGLIEGLKKAAGKTHKDEKCHLYLVVPFLSETAENYIQNFNKLALIQGLGNLQIHLITSNRKITSMQNHFTYQETEQLAKFDAKAFGTHNWLREYVDLGRGTQAPTVCLTITEWKVPDEKSFPLTGKHGPNKEEFITSHRAPYKKPKPV